MSSPEGKESPDPLPGSAFRDGVGSSLTGGVACFFRMSFAPEAFVASALGTTGPGPFLMTSDKISKHERRGEGF